MTSISLVRSSVVQVALVVHVLGDILELKEAGIEYPRVEEFAGILTILFGSTPSRNILSISWRVSASRRIYLRFSSLIGCL